MAKLPKCCRVQRNCAGNFEVCHLEASPFCSHAPSGGQEWNYGPYTRIIGNGRTKTSAIADARNYFYAARRKARETVEL